MIYLERLKTRSFIATITKNAGIPPMSANFMLVFRNEKVKFRIINYPPNRTIRRHRQKRPVFNQRFVTSSVTPVVWFSLLFTGSFRPRITTMKDLSVILLLAGAISVALLPLIGEWMHTVDAH